MRQAQQRTLSAMGFIPGRRLRTPGLRAHSLLSETGAEQILVRGKLLGPSWPSIAWTFEIYGIEYKLLELSEVWLLVEKNDESLELLTRLSVAARTSISQDVYLPLTGFVQSGVKKQFDLKFLIAPITIFAVTAGLAFSKPAGTNETIPEPQEFPKIVCALDLSSSEFQQWLQQSVFESETTSNRPLVLQTSFGLLNLTVESEIGSTQFFTGYLECQDGRTTELHFRADKSAKGRLVLLGEKLDP